MSYGTHTRVLITGGASGLGRALALRCARAGWRVAVADVNDERTVETCRDVDDLGGVALGLHCDITRSDDVEGTVDRIRDAWGGLDVLVNNAGVASAGTVLETGMDDWRWMLEINLLGSVEVTRACLPLLQAEPRAHILNVASAAGIAQAPGMASYSVAKAGVIALSETLHHELAATGVKVTVVCPSFFQTNLLESYRGPGGSREFASKLMDRASVAADDVAGRMFDVIGKDQLFVHVHAESRWAHRAKRYVPDTFHGYMRRLAGKLGRPGGGPGADGE